MSYETNIPQAVEAESLILGSILKSNYEGLNEVMEYVLGRAEPLTAAHMKALGPEVVQLGHDGCIHGWCDVRNARKVTLQCSSFVG